jgi:hypothetical protein
MAGFDPAILFAASTLQKDHRVKPGDDDLGGCSLRHDEQGRGS